MLLKNQWVNEGIKKENKNTSRQMIMHTHPFKIYGMPQKQCLEESSEQYRPSSEKKKNLKSTI